MQKTLRFLVYSMLAMVCLFTACSDDDDNDSVRIVHPYQSGCSWMLRTMSLYW